MQLNNVFSSEWGVKMEISASASFPVQALRSSKLARMRHIQISVYRLIFPRIRAQRFTCHCCFSRWNGFGLDFNMCRTLWVCWTRPVFTRESQGSTCFTQKKKIWRATCLASRSFFSRHCFGEIETKLSLGVAEPDFKSKASIGHHVRVEGGRKEGRKCTGSVTKWAKYQLATHTDKHLYTVTVHSQLIGLLHRSI